MPPNVVFVITDDQGYGDIGCHGNPWLRTPNLDKMARESVQLDEQHHDPLCSPSRAALLTGQYAARNGVWHVIHGRHLLDPKASTLADVFAANGYTTGMFGKWHLGDSAPFAPHCRGFDESLCHRGGGIGELPDYWGNNYVDDSYFRNGAAEACQGYCTDVFFDAALEFIESRAGSPFFVYLATNAMHAPHIVPERYIAPYMKRGIPERRARFYGMIANFDENMGKLFTRLAELGLDEDTIVIFTSDHGTAAGCDPATGAGYNAGLRGKKGSLYDGGHRVSFFLRWKGQLPAGKTVDQPTAHIDIMPTLVELCGLTCDLDFDGESLAPLIRGEVDSLAERAIVIQLQPDQPLKWNQTAVIRGSWRLLEDELYDVSRDPGQERDIAGEHRQVVAALRQDYDAWWAEMQPAFASTVAIPVGETIDDPAPLSARDWHPTAGTVPWRQAWIDDPARDANGYWIVDVLRAGAYEFELRAYPREAGLPGGVCWARLRVGKAECAKSLGESELCARFQLDLEPGRKRLESWLHTADGRERGAYYVYVTRIESDGS